MTRVAILTEIPAPFRIPLFNELAARPGVDLDVVFLGAGQPNRRYRRHENEIRFAWRVLPGVTPTVRGRWLALNAGVLRTVARADVVVAGGWNQPAFWQAALAARMLRRRFALWVESTDRDQRGGTWAAERAKRALVRTAAAVIVPGRASAAYAESLGARDVIRAPNAVDASVFGTRVDDARRRRNVLRSQLGVERCCFLAVGRLAPEKGFETLLRAFADVEGAELVVAGTGPDEEHLRALAPPTVRFLGHVDRDDLPCWYAVADCLVAPSHSEPWGFAIQEAALAGLPIVASDAAGAAWDLVDPAVNGYRVAPGDAAGLTVAMQRLVDDAAFRGRAGARSRQLAAVLTPAAWADALQTFATS